MLSKIIAVSLVAILVIVFGAATYVSITGQQIIDPKPVYACQVGFPQSIKDKDTEIVVRVCNETDEDGKYVRPFCNAARAEEGVIDCCAKCDFSGEHYTCTSCEQDLVTEEKAETGVFGGIGSFLRRAMGI